jgi:hypothetical protein
LSAGRNSTYKKKVAITIVKYNETPCFENDVSRSIGHVPFVVVMKTIVESSSCLISSSCHTSQLLLIIIPMRVLFELEIHFVYTNDIALYISPHSHVCISALSQQIIFFGTLIMLHRFIMIAETKTRERKRVNLLLSRFFFSSTSSSSNERTIDRSIGFLLQPFFTANCRQKRKQTNQIKSP